MKGFDRFAVSAEEGYVPASEVVSRIRSIALGICGDEFASGALQDIARLVSSWDAAVAISEAYDAFEGDDDTALQAAESAAWAKLARLVKKT